jgi:hypothetical protein
MMPEGQEPNKPGVTPPVKPEHPVVPPPVVPPPVVPPKPEHPLADKAKEKLKEEAKEKAKEKREIAEKESKANIAKMEAECGEVIEEYGGQESNIPVWHHYWNLRNQIRAELNRFK